MHAFNKSGSLFLNNNVIFPFVIFSLLKCKTKSLIYQYWHLKSSVYEVVTARIVTAHPLQSVCDVGLVLCFKCCLLININLFLTTFRFSFWNLDSIWLWAKILRYITTKSEWYSEEEEEKFPLYNIHLV